MHNMKVNNEKMNTLNGTIDELNQRLYELIEVANLSDKLLRKFLNLKGEAMDEIEPIDTEKHGTIVDEFANISTKISSNINIIGGNLNEVLKMVD